jgi:beta-phosphoglucomutase-like phosphatase (HAD superfamily)
MALIELACLDMAGTTVRDDGAVERAFTVAAGAVGIVPGSRAFAAAMAIVHETMGQAKIEVFRRILGEEETAQRANRAFESAYADLLSGGVVTALPGAVETLTALRECGIKVPDDRLRPYDTRCAAREPRLEAPGGPRALPR